MFAAIQDRGRGGCTKLLDQLASGAVFLHVKLQNRGYRVEAHRQPQIGAPHHSAAPLPWVKKPITEKLGMMAV